MKKSLNLILEDEDIIELMRILMDSDVEGAKGRRAICWKVAEK